MKNSNNISQNSFFNSSSLMWLKVEGYEVKNPSISSDATASIFKLYGKRAGFKFSVMSTLLSFIF